ncbi:MAG: DUF3015 family protein [Leptospiraceae bacterium]|nr:DUF3015 family protein [Leptospiraceae bacterium]MCP5492935.1 DUF3015 family protein [Leptospiraceae bacterium]
MNKGIILYGLLGLSIIGLYAQGQNTVQEFEFAPGLLTGDYVKLPEIKLNQTGDVYGEDDNKSDKLSEWDITTTSTWGITTYPTTTSRMSTERIVQIKRELFIVFNYKHLEKEMAQGSGERMNVLAFLYGCPLSAKKTFGSTIRNSYTNLFQNVEKLTVAIFEKRIQKVLKSNKELAMTCIAY